MARDARPVVVSFDGSPESRAALRAATDLFGERLLLLVCVWEPGLAMAVQSAPDTLGYAYPLPDPEQMARVDDSQRDHADAIAEAGARFARERGATAEPLAVPDGG